MTTVRVITAAVLAPLVVAVVLWTETWVVAGLAAGAVILCLYEFFRLASAAGLKGHPRWTTGCALFLVGLQWLEASHRGLWMRTEFGLLYSPDHSPAPPEMALAVFLLGAAALAVAGKEPAQAVLSGLGADCGGMVLVAMPLSYVVRLHALQPQGPRLLLFLLATLWTGDTLAYFAGRAIGRHKLAPEISPGKTWEGAAANLAGAVLVGLVAARWISTPAAHLAGVAVLANLAGQLGDLTESAYKRAAGAKDSGTLLPGHGGMLDRLDSLIFAAPVVWYYFCMVLPAAG